MSAPDPRQGDAPRAVAASVPITEAGAASSVLSHHARQLTRVATHSMLAAAQDDASASAVHDRVVAARDRRASCRPQSPTSSEGASSAAFATASSASSAAFARDSEYMRRSREPSAEAVRAVSGVLDDSAPRASLQVPTKLLRTGKGARQKKHHQHLHHQNVPDSGGDVVIALRRLPHLDTSLSKEERNNIERERGRDLFEKHVAVVARLLDLDLSIKIRSLHRYREAARKDLSTCRDCLCCPCLKPILPGCVTQHGVATSEIGTIIYVGATTDQLDRLNRYVERQRWEASASMTPFQYMRKTAFTAAQRSRLLLHAVQGAKPCAGLCVDDVIIQIATLHDPLFVEKFFFAYTALGLPKDSRHRINVGERRLAWGDASILDKIRFMISVRVSGGFYVDQLRASTAKDMVSSGTAEWISGVEATANYVHELRAQYGEQAGWYYAFNRHWILWLRWPAGLGLAVVVFKGILLNPEAGRIVDALYGFFLAAVWGPAFLGFWRQSQNEYAFLWNIESSKLIANSDAEEPNPNYRGENIPDILTLKMRKHFSHRWRTCYKILRWGFIGCFYLFWVYVFVQVSLTVCCA